MMVFLSVVTYAYDMFCVCYVCKRFIAVKLTILFVAAYHIVLCHLDCVDNVKTKSRRE